MSNSGISDGDARPISKGGGSQHLRNLWAITMRPMMVTPFAPVAAALPAARARRRKSVAVVAPQDAARAAKLRYVADTRPGIRRRRAGKHWSFTAPDGATIADRAEILRIKSLAIPPAWSDVWICPDANGHIQATGRDAKGRKQYRYHVRWHDARGETKFNRMVEFAHALPHIRRHTERDLASPGLPREKVLAAVVRLLEYTLIRIGNDEYARDNDSFGLTTMREDHADVSGTTIKFNFRGKSGKDHEIGLNDRRLARIIKRCQDLPGEDLFQYINGDGTPHTINSSDVNEYIRAIAGDEFTAKDFRTWAGTVLAAMALQRAGEAATASEAKRMIGGAIEEVAAVLGNTKTVCRKSYVHPIVIEMYEAGTLIDMLAAVDAAKADGLAPEETAVLGVLERYATQPVAKAS